MKFRESSVLQNGSEKMIRNFQNFHVFSAGMSPGKSLEGSSFVKELLLKGSHIPKNMTKIYSLDDELDTWMDEDFRPNQVQEALIVWVNQLDMMRLFMYFSVCWHTQLRE